MRKFLSLAFDALAVVSAFLSVTDPRQFYFSGTNFGDAMWLLALTGLFAVLAIKAWPRRQRSAWDLR
jgi:hypothetical protein